MILAIHVGDMAATPIFSTEKSLLLHNLHIALCLSLGCFLGQYLNL